MNADAGMEWDDKKATWAEDWAEKLMAEKCSVSTAALRSFFCHQSRRISCRYVAIMCEPNALASGFSDATATENPRLAPSAQSFHSFAVLMASIDNLLSMSGPRRA